MTERLVGRRRIKVSNPGKVLYPDSGITKSDVIDYYAEIAPVMVPEMKDRLVTMERFPDGIEGHRIMHKDAPDYFPSWIERKTVPKKGGHVSHVICNDAATLVYLANQACITPHISLSRKDRPDHPDQMILDLDPSTEDFASVRATALDLRTFLEDLELVPFVKTTGSRGLHLVVPLRRKDDYDDVGWVAERIAIRFAEQSPKTLTVEFRKAKRDGRIFVDWMRNNWAQTAVAPYALRPLPGAPVAMPLYWDEVQDSTLVPGRYRIRDALKSVNDGRDPWRGWRRRARSLDRARSKLGLEG